MALNDDTMRNLNMKMKEVPERYGLWDDIYDKRVIRALDCNLQWKPNRKEEERRKKVQQKRMKERMRRKNQNKVDGDDQGNEENYQPFQDSKDKWFATGTDYLPRLVRFSCDIVEHVLLLRPRVDGRRHEFYHAAHQLHRGSCPEMVQELSRRVSWRQVDERALTHALQADLPRW